MTVNTSPETIVNGHFASVLEGYPLERIVVEVTEHQVVERYEDIAAVMLPLQSQGLRVAIDDAGAGYASFRHILNLHPNIVKMDYTITHCIDSDRSRCALAAAMHGFASETGCNIVAEGVETRAELETLRRLGIGKAQGYHLGRPMPLEQRRAWWATGRTEARPQGDPAAAPRRSSSELESGSGNGRVVTEAIRPGRQHLKAGLGDQHHVLPLG